MSKRETGREPSKIIEVIKHSQKNIKQKEFNRTSFRIVIRLFVASVKGYFTKVIMTAFTSVINTHVGLERKHNLEVQFTTKCRGCLLSTRFIAGFI